jgi:hypothetical protein
MRSSIVVPAEAILSQQFNAIRSDAAGGGSLLPHQQLGKIALPTNPSNNQTLTLTINGTAVVLTFVSSIGSTAGNVLIGSTAAITTANAVALLNQPQTTTSTGVALSAPNQTLVGYLSWSLSGTTITPSSNNNTQYAPQTSFTAATTATGGSYTANTMAVYVEPGIAYIGSSATRVIFAGGNSPTITAPSTNPRIDLLTLDSSGTLALVTGSENASPTAPAYPANKLVLCEIYNVVAETKILDNANQASGQGYISNDTRAFLAQPFNAGSIPADLLPDADGTRNLGSGSFQWNNLYVKTGIFLNGSSINSQLIAASTSAEAISANAAVAMGYYQSDSGIQFDGAVRSGTVNTSGTSGTISVTIGSNSNRVLLVALMSPPQGGSSVLPSSIQFNGVNMTNVVAANYSLNGNVNPCQMAILAAPATGTHNLTFTGPNNQTMNYVIWSLYNCDQSTVPDNSGQSQASGGAGNPSVAITPNTIADIIFSVTNSGSRTGSITWENTGNTGSLYFGDSGKIFPLISTSSAAGASGSYFMLSVAIKPVTAATLGYVVNASASGASSDYADNYTGYRSSLFLGFAVAGVSANTALNIIMGGIFATLSGLVAGVQYYLANTGGTIATTAGTITRKIGLSISSTALLITNIW